MLLNFTKKIKLGVVTLFALGRAVDEEVQMQIRIESSIYHDIIQQSFWDTYETLTYKVSLSCIHK